jgi:micrococcal nuclease
MIAKYALVLLLFIPVVQQKNITGKVIHVVDGDTIDILYENKPLRIRLAGIDCPEKGQPFATAAKQETARLCAGQIVTVFIKGKDRYKRILGDIQLPDRKILNQELVRSGLAWHYKHYSSDSALAALEASSVTKALAIWSQSDPMPPWEYRRLKK